jgi:hypothetical protein
MHCLQIMDLSCVIALELAQNAPNAPVFEDNTYGCSHSARGAIKR